ncbi:MAG: thioesterase, partial [Lutibacter sp.]|nr:thioesterase [Lutibacter sp.]
RWRFNHHIYNEAGKLSAEIKVYGAWIDLVKRKLTSPPQKFVTIFDDLPKSENFQEILLKSEK